MKRIRYISRFNTDMNSDDISALVEQSQANNTANDITGLLIATGKVFFQILEGPDTAVDTVFNKIIADDRHRNVLVLGMEQGDIMRLCPDWAMMKVDVSEPTTDALLPVRNTLESIFLQKESVDKLVDALEHFTWNEVLKASTKS